MPHPFLTAARQGSYRRQHYALSLLLILALLWSSIVTIAVLLTLGLTLWQGAIADNITVQQWQADHPQLFMGMALGVLLLLSFGIALAVQAIHRRPWQTLLRGQGAVQWRRAGLSCGLWLGLSGLNIGLLALAAGDRYQFPSSAWGEWVAALPWALVIAAIAGFTTSLAYGYTLQGLGLLIRHPQRLAIALGVMGGLLALPRGIHEASLLWVVMAAFNSWFSAWLVLRSYGMELFLGLHTANTLVNVWIVGHGESDSPWLLPTLLTLQPDAALWPGALTYGLRCGLFVGVMLTTQRHPPQHQEPA
jgi:hypothetical protein